MIDVEKDLALHIRGFLAGAPHSLTVANCRAGPPKKPTENQAITGAVPSRCVFVQGTGGFQPTAFVDGGLGTKDARPTAQIWIRSNPRDYDGGRALALAVFGAVDLNPPSGYYESRALMSEPGYVREDEQNHHEWTVNVMLRTHA